MEIGSFIELQMPDGKEYYTENGSSDMQLARLNSGRAAIWHSFRLTGCDSIWIPYYQCETVREFLGRKGASVKYYHINDGFEPVDLCPVGNEAVLLVNYYGMFSCDRMKSLSENYSNVIIDNSQAFFCKPIEDCLNVYSCRKFVGVPDGAYVLGKNACSYTEEYEQGYSSDTALFLLQRIEYGCQGKAYSSRESNEERIDTEDIKKMSKLTYYILDGTDYDLIKRKRRNNFEYAHSLFGGINKLNPMMYYSADTVPMVYPLLIEKDELLDVLLKNQHFQGHWWGYVTKETPADSFEHYLSRYMVPVTIDQRYDNTALDSIFNIVSEIL